MLKKYKAIFFDWDGTAVMSRRAPVDQAVAAMRPLLQKGIKLIIVSGTTIENIAGGKIESYFAEEELKNLILDWGEVRTIIPLRMEYHIYLKIWFRTRVRF